MTVAREGLRDVVAGFLPLVDAALLVAAREKGFAEAEGLALTLVRETSWANIRDRVAVGHFQCAHMLAPMPIAARLGLTPMPADIIAPMALGLGGDAVTVSRPLYAALAVAGALDGLNAAAAGQALAASIRARREAGQPNLVFAVVHPHSAHNYDMRYWLHSSGIDPDKDLEIVVVPPPFLPDALAAGRIDGYCVGEPWSSVAAQRGKGIIITSVSAIWRSSPEKVLGVEASFAESDPETVDAMVRALYAAARWCAEPETGPSSPASCRARTMSASMPEKLCRRSPAGSPSATARPSTTLNFSFPSGAPRPSPGKAMRAGSIRRWCAGAMRSGARRMRRERRRFIGPTSIAGRLPAPARPFRRTTGRSRALLPGGADPRCRRRYPAWTRRLFRRPRFNPDALQEYVESQRR